MNEMTELPGGTTYTNHIDDYNKKMSIIFGPNFEDGSHLTDELYQKVKKLSDSFSNGSLTFFG